MKIHIFIAHMSIGGAERVCVNLANEFVKKGHEVHIVVLNLENDVNTHLLDERVQVHSLGVSRLRYSFLAIFKYVKKYRPPFMFVFGNEMAVYFQKKAIETNLYMEGELKQLFGKTGVIFLYK